MMIQETTYDVLSMNPEELSQMMVALGHAAYRGRQLFEWLWRRRVSGYEEITVWPKALRQEMQDRAPFRRLTADNIQVAPDGTKKILLKLRDNERVETVLLPHDYGVSVCVSSQVGCAMGCNFCASGLNGKLRNLSVGEILDQVRFADSLIAPADQHVSRIDLMGIGEPLDNYANMVKFMAMIHNPQGFNLSYRHLAVSTSGVVPKIYQLADEGIPVTLAVSLHAPNDALRLSLMPINRAYPLNKLIPACRYYSDTTGRRVTFEYLLLKDVNDQPEHAAELANLLSGFSCHVNLIPWNPVAEHPFQPSSTRRVKDFQEIVQQRGISCTIRKEMGQEIEAACGQLRNREEELLSP